jgi:Tfp pilus assembly protein PilF
LNKGVTPPSISKGSLRRGPGKGGPAETPDGLLERLYADPENAALLRSLAEVYAREGELELATLVLHRALEVAPKEATSNNLLGLVYLLQGKDQEASSCFLKAMELDHSLDEAKANLVVLYHGYGNNQKAREMLGQVRNRDALSSSEAVAVHPDFSMVTDRLKVALLQELPKETREGR